MLHRRPLNFKLSTLNFFGFTLLELLVALAIMAMLTGMSMPAISGYLKGARLRGAARQVASALRQARQLAITRRARRAVLLYLQDSTAITFYNAVSIYENDTLSCKYLPETISLLNTAGLEGVNGDPYDVLITFTARGTAGNGGTVRVSDTVGSFREITVLGVTGRVRIGDVNEDL